MAKVLILASDLSAVTGSAVYSEELARRLRGVGHEVTVLCFRGTPRLLGHCRVIEIGRAPRRSHRVLWRIASYLDERHCDKVVRAVSSLDCEFAIALEHMLIRPVLRRYPGLPWFYVPLSLIAPVEIDSYRLPGIAATIARRHFAGVQKWALNHATATMRFTKLSCDLLTRFYGFTTPPRYVVNQMPVSIPPEHARVRTEQVRFLTVGRITESKNVQAAIAALAPLAGQKWQYDIVGEGEWLPSLKRQIESLRLSSQVRCHGRQESLSDWYSNADLFLFTSRLDNCPIAVLEAMAHGVPVLAIKPDGEKYQSAIEEMVQHKVDGLVAFDECDFHEWLRKVVVEPALLFDYAMAARQRIISHHTWDAHIAKYNAVLRHGIEGRPALHEAVTVTAD